MVYLVVSVWAVVGVIGAMIATARKVNALAGAVLGILLGPIGWLIVAISKPNTGRMRQCPFCKEWVPVAAVVCSHCARDLPPVPQIVKPPSDERALVVIAWTAAAIGFLALCGTALYIALA